MCNRKCLQARGGHVWYTKYGSICFTDTHVQLHVGSQLPLPPTALAAPSWRKRKLQHESCRWACLTPGATFKRRQVLYQKEIPYRADLAGHFAALQRLLPSAPLSPDPVPLWRKAAGLCCCSLCRVLCKRVELLCAQAVVWGHTESGSRGWKHYATWPRPPGLVASPRRQHESRSTVARQAPTIDAPCPCM